MPKVLFCFFLKTLSRYKKRLHGSLINANEIVMKQANEIVMKHHLRVA
jgi:hypothetical protein